MLVRTGNGVAFIHKREEKALPILARARGCKREERDWRSTKCDTMYSLEESSEICELTIILREHVSIE
jgi:hypothetical protein